MNHTRRGTSQAFANLSGSQYVCHLYQIYNAERHQGIGASNDTSLPPIREPLSRISMRNACSPMGTTTSRLPCCLVTAAPCKQETDCSSGSGGSGRQSWVQLSSNPAYRFTRLDLYICKAHRAMAAQNERFRKLRSGAASIRLAAALGSAVERLMAKAALES